MGKRKIIIERIRTQHFATTVGKLYGDWKDSVESSYPYAEKFILGHPVPDFQRKLCWAASSKKSFIESIYRHYDIGSYMLATYSSNDKGEFVKYSDCIIDGQQRLDAIQSYWMDEFKVLGYFWSELTSTDRRIFRNIGFGHVEIMTLDRSILIETYNRLNFAGVNHKAADRAK